MTVGQLKRILRNTSEDWDDHEVVVESKFGYVSTSCAKITDIIEDVDEDDEDVQRTVLLIY